MEISSSYFIAIPEGIPTQGDIYQNLPFISSDFEFEIGILITPKCDFVHEKTSVVSFIPGINIRDYFSLFGLSRILEIEKNKQVSLLSDLRIEIPSFSLIEIGVPVNEVVMKVKNDYSKFEQKSKKIDQQIVRLEDTSKRISQIESLLKCKKLKESDVCDLIKPKDIRTHRERVIRNQIVDLHFLPPCSPLLNEPVVLLLRHVNTCSINLLHIAHKSISDETWKKECSRLKKDNKILKFCKSKPERILRLKSPYMENLMSRFAFLFMRIGIPDFKRSDFQNFINEV